MRQRVAFLLILAMTVALAASCAALAAPRRPAPTMRVADLLLVGFRGTEVEGNEEIRRLVCHVKVGGVVLFERDLATGQPRNLVSSAQVAKLTGDLQSLARECARRPLFIAADNEGGHVMRLSTRLGYPPSLSATEMGQADVAATEAEARRVGVLLREAGINWNLAPVVDVAVNPANPAVVALGRTFSADPEQVVAHASAYIRGMRAEGILTSLKHFPGHGSSQKDSHAGFTDVTDTADLDAELLPYRALIKAGLADSVMTAHVFNKGLDPWDPATLSRYTINRILRNRFDYKGVIVSDDLLMGAIVKHYGLEEASAKALNAGVDMLLISGNTPKAEVFGAERVVLAINRAVTSGLVSRKRVLEAIAHVDALRSRLPK